MTKHGLLAVFAALFLPLAARAADNGNITLHITGLDNDKGVVRIAVFNSKDAYASSRASADQSGGAYRKATAAIKNQATDYTFEQIPYGDYAIKLFHDEDNSGKFITGMFGIPKVQYAFSNNAKGMMGPASYDKAKFTVNSNQTNMTIKMIGR